MRFVWLHGFASSPQSGKGQFVAAQLRARGVELVLPDLNEPSFFDLTVTRMLGQVDEVAGPDPVVLLGSSLGGFTAATWAALRPGRTAALVLLAPAFDLAPRWAARMTPHELAQWRREGRVAMDHYAWGRKEDLGIGFLDDAQVYTSYPLCDAPTLVVQGQRDDVVEPELAREFARRMRERAVGQGADPEQRVKLVELDQGHELNADLPLLWRVIEPHLAPWLPR